MPKAKTKRRPQCGFSEGGRRCLRDSMAGADLCKPHLIFVAQRARGTAQQPVQQPPRNQTVGPASPASSIGAVVGDLLGDFFDGKPFDPDKAKAAINNYAEQWGMGGIFGGGSGTSPPIAEDRSGPYVPPQERARQAWQNVRQQARRPPPPPPQGPSPQEIANAKRELGFGDYEHIDEATLKDRQRKLARKFHPDTAGRDERKRKQLTEKMARVNNAVDVIAARGFSATQP